MAFMMPVMKNEWDIYQSGRSRRSSECSNPRSCRSRGVSESKSEGPSLSTSPASVGDFHMASSPHRLHHLMMTSGQHQRHYQIQRQRRSSSSRGLSRTSSSQRASQSSLPSPPTKSPDDEEDEEEDEELGSNAASPSKAGSQSSLNKFHARVLDKLKRSLRVKSSDSAAKTPVTAGLPPPAS